MERILITGALGQLGQEFIKFFNKNNTYVLATDIRSPLKDLSCDFEIADAMDEKRIDYLIKKKQYQCCLSLSRSPFCKRRKKSIYGMGNKHEKFSKYYKFIN